VTDSYSQKSARFGARRKILEGVAAKPRPQRVSPSSLRRVAAEGVTRDGGRVQLADFAHVRTKLGYAGRGHYDYRGAGADLSPKQLAAARRNLERARAAKRGR
jgi:hypothetical protein